MRPTSTCLVSLATLTLLPGQEVAVPEFDTEKAKASYVLARPPVSAKQKIDAGESTPLILDFHGAIHPSRKGANVTYGRVWKNFVELAPVTVLGLNSRTRGWNMTKGKEDDTAYALHVLDLVKKQHAISTGEIFLAGFSSGSDFLCKGGLQLRAKFAGSLVVCPGPASVLGLRKGEILRVKEHPFYFVTGQEDYIRKDGAWQAFLALEKAGGRVMYREVPELGHVFPAANEYVRCYEYLRVLAGIEKADHAKLANDALRRRDFLLASTHAKKMGSKGKPILAKIEALGESMLANAEKTSSWEGHPGATYEAWWALRTQFHRFPKIAERAEKELTAKRGITNREMLRARREFFKQGGTRPRTVTPQPPRRRQPQPQPKKSQSQSAKSLRAVGPWAFDRYLSYDEVAARLQQLAKENPNRVRLTSMGKSVQGRDLWVCEITDDVKKLAHKPAIYVQGGIHGNEISSVMVTLYFAWQMGANPDRRRSIDRLLRDTTFYVAPAVNPDAVQHFVTKPNSLWRPRFNMRPHDADGDGKVDEDGYEDVNGDGQISQMYVKDDKGVFVLKDGRMVRDRTGKITPRFRHVGREGFDNDGDGKYSEDPAGGVNLNRNFPVGYRQRRDFEGFRGTGPASEPETRAIIEFVHARPNINLFFDYHNAANCVFYWAGPDGKDKDADDFALMTAIAGRAKKKLGFTPRPLNHNGVGLSIAWAYGERSIPACIVELEVGDEKEWAQAGQEIFVKATKHAHPKLGEVWIGNDHKKLPKRNPPPSGIYEQVSRNWGFMRDELKELPKLKLEQPRVVRRGRDSVGTGSLGTGFGFAGTGFSITGFVANWGKMAMTSHRERRLGKASDIRITARGAKVTGTTTLPALAAGARQPFAVELTDVQDSATLVVAHPKGGTIELLVRRPRVATVPVRKRYAIADGYQTADEVLPAKIEADNGPRFTVPHKKKELRVAVLLGEFDDLKHTVPAKTFEASLFAGDYRANSHTGQPVYGSVRDFYKEMSYGAMNVTGRVFDWVELPGNYEDYRKASFGSSKFRTALERAVMAEHGADALSGFDGMIFVWAGNPVHRVSCLWPMRVPLKHRPGVIAFKTGEFYRGQMAPIGVACHEMGHTFGVNDKYGLGAPTLPMGRWCLMCKGTHGSGESMQHRPFHLCAWCKTVIGWLQPVVIDPKRFKQSKKLALRPILFSPKECFRILLKPDGSEYVLLTNRRKEGFMTELPSAGLVVLKVGPNTRPSAPQKQVKLIPAHGLGPAKRSELQKLDQIAWPQPGKTALTVKSEDGTASVRISGIRLVDDVVYFEIAPSGE